MALEVREVAREMLRELGPLIRLVQIHDPGLAKQMKESGQSVLLNIGEGVGRYGRDRLYHYSVSHGSAQETVDALVAAEAFGYLDAAATEKVRGLLTRVIQMLWRLVHPRVRQSS